jgi:hypothetical protein
LRYYKSFNLILQMGKHVIFNDRAKKSYTKIVNNLIPLNYEETTQI